MEEKLLTKKEQIIVIIDALKQFRKLDDKINSLFNGELDKNCDVYNIGYKVIPAILGVANTGKFNDDHEKLGDLFFNYICGDITKKEYFNEIDKYLEG